MSCSWCIQNDWIKLEVTEDQGNYIYYLTDKIHRRVMADMDYVYSLTESAVQQSLVSRTVEATSDRCQITGEFSGGWRFTQIFSLAADERFLEESITILNASGETASPDGISFGFCSRLFGQFDGWSGDLDTLCVMSLPTRRYRSQRQDRRMERYTAHDLCYSPWNPGDGSLKPGYGAEGWLWADDTGGLLICKYNPTEIEYSRFERLPIPLPGRGVQDVCVLFGGATYLRGGDPEALSALNPGESYTFGVTRYTAYSGEYPEGCYVYRRHLEDRGHGTAPDYDPPVHWNELYNLGWFAEKEGFFSEARTLEVYSLEDLYREAKIAKAVGAECLYLDPGWDTFPGSAVWNEERLGDFADFAKTIHEIYGLKVALHLLQTFMSDKEDPSFFWRDGQGNPAQGGFMSLFSFCPNGAWIREKTARLQKLADEGADFFMFDFCDFGNERHEGCCDPSHGHETPMRRQVHADGILHVIKALKRHKPALLIEAHDRITGGLSDYHPMYFQQGAGSFDENWGYEYMWNALADLISMKSVSLYEYNLCCSIPLYLHINEHGDNDQMLQFWWTASLVRHLGIGGLKPEDRKFPLLQAAMKLYHAVKPLLVRGTFYGMDPFTHIHVDQTGEAVVTLFNITSRPQSRRLELDCRRFSLTARSIKAYTGTGVELPVCMEETETGVVISVEVASLSPVIVTLHHPDHK